MLQNKIPDKYTDVWGWEALGDQGKDYYGGFLRYTVWPNGRTVVYRFFSMGKIVIW
jgi:hypothetical protein